MGYLPVFVGYLFLFLGAFTSSALSVGYGTWLFWAGFLGIFSALVYWKAEDRPRDSSGEAWLDFQITVEEVLHSVED